MTFDTILNLVSPDFSKNSQLANKAMFVYDEKSRQLNSLNFHDGYTISEKSKKALKFFDQNPDNKKVCFFIVHLDTDSIYIYDDKKGLKLKLTRVS